MIQHQETWLLLKKMFQRRESSCARRMLRDHTTCSHFLGMIRMFLSSVLKLSDKHCVSMVIAIVVSLLLKNDSEQTAGQQMIHFSCDNIFLAVIWLKTCQVGAKIRDNSTWVGSLSLWLDSSGNYWIDVCSLNSGLTNCKRENPSRFKTCELSEGLW